MGGIATNGSLLTGRTIEYYKAQPPAFVMRVFQRPPSLLLKTSFNLDYALGFYYKNKLLQSQVLMNILILTIMMIMPPCQNNPKPLIFLHFVLSQRILVHNPGLTSC